MIKIEYNTRYIPTTMGNKSSRNTNNVAVQPPFQFTNGAPIRTTKFYNRRPMFDESADITYADESDPEYAKIQKNKLPRLDEFVYPENKKMGAIIDHVIKTYITDGPIPANILHLSDGVTNIPLYNIIGGALRGDARMYAMYAMYYGVDNINSSPVAGCSNPITTLIHTSAEQGDSWGQFLLASNRLDWSGPSGIDQLKDMGVIVSEQDRLEVLEQAQQVLYRSAMQDNVCAIRLLGNIYFKGNDVTRPNVVESVRLVNRFNQLTSHIEKGAWSSVDPHFQAQFVEYEKYGNPFVFTYKSLKSVIKHEGIVLLICSYVD
jgi:hypothetical protein